jgi:hypothetical protein
MQRHPMQNRAEFQMPVPPAHHQADVELKRLLRFNHQVLAQALAVVTAHELPSAPAYELTAGPHLRHVIEHFEALVLELRRGRVEYDQRPRDRELERRPGLARQRLLALQQALSAVGEAPDLPLRVRGLGGTGGEFEFDVPSSFGRELVFLASHAIHHFALLLPYCQQHGIAVGADFGKAPSTVAFETRQRP